MNVSNSRDDSRSAGRRTVLKAGLAGLATPFLVRFSSAAAAYPDRPIKLLVPFGVGGPVDIVARVMAPLLGEVLGGSVFVENKPGASGNLGTAAAARTEPDGYTIVVAASNFIINKILFAKIPYDPIADFIPLVELAETPSAFGVRPELGAKNLKEFVEIAKSKSFSYSHPGFGTVSHMAGEVLKSRAGINMVAVTHNGGGPAVQTLMPGAVEFCSAALPALHPHVKSGLIVGLGVTSAKRWPDLAEMPTVEEAGFPDFDLANFTALLVPAKTPPEIVDRVSKASLEILKRPDVQSKLLTLGFAVTARPPDVLKARLERELPFWKSVVETAGIKPT